MSTARDCLEAVIQLQEAHRTLFSIVAGHHGDWRLTLVRQRKTIAILIGEVSVKLGELQMDDSLPSSTALEARRWISRYRHVLAAHQAQHPAVKITDDSEEYLNSASNVAKEAEIIFSALCKLLRP